MSHRLTTAVNIGEYASSILQQVKVLQKEEFLNQFDRDEPHHFGIEPMLLALAMEFALKAWYVFDHDTADIMKSHHLLELFESLNLESRNKLELEFKRSVAPFHPQLLHEEYSMKKVLDHHANAFVEWRYLHERKKSLSFNQSTFTATLEMVLREFKKRYRTEKISPKTPAR